MGEAGAHSGGDRLLGIQSTRFSNFQICVKKVSSLWYYYIYPSRIHWRAALAEI